jgi:hypothetical protein
MSHAAIFWGRAEKLPAHIGLLFDQYSMKPLSSVPATAHSF